MKNKILNEKIDRNQHYKGRAKSAMGRFALGVGILSIVIFLTLVVMAGSEDSSVVESIAGLSFLDFLLTIFGMIISCRGVRDHNGAYGSAFVGLVLNTIMFIVLISMFLIGL
ncbi:MAG: hypothetical protein IJZ25_01340 [Lachnospiraceae bacterium]|nr:hypothetical protein [Lachnospiraceae bacterium]